ncbi:family 1 glycosylhydrolase [Lactobacillus sp. M0396]|uniref:family 1 glycosylhydrolase n=1 Tax=Lactobacillus sp. M0396 TaxID=2751030 RepID=UPI00351BC399
MDKYHRYPEDLDIFIDLGINCYRFQTSWSRVNLLGDGNFMPFSYYQSSTM